VLFGSRKIAIDRVWQLANAGRESGSRRAINIESLLESDTSAEPWSDESSSEDFALEQETASKVVSDWSSQTEIELKKVGFNFGLFGFLLICLGLSVGVFWFLQQVLAPSVSVAISGLFFALPFGVLGARKQKRAALFAKDYPTVLMATASSVKAGLTPQHALERATEMLPKDSIVKSEVRLMLERIQAGCPKEIAVARFAGDIDEPEISLFRSALLLTERNGGRFAPTLERLARVCQDRSNLVSEARVSSATMRMTANFLLLVCPIILGIISVRTKDFWEIIVENSTANFLASLGLVMIVGGYFWLRRLSDFKP